ncbi:hypothetical protein GCM10010246_05050 [Streptomyces cuspidosporus]|uniref:Rrf2 family transcriptional regulator n=1 Tax=Streptomyces cuspidosporus TaxID=66882 RepID=A0ABP5S950_9ACTN
MAQGIPHTFLDGILGDLRRGGPATSRRAGNGGYRLARPADEIAVADVIRVADAPVHRPLISRAPGCRPPVGSGGRQCAITGIRCRGQRVTGRS